MNRRTRCKRGHELVPGNTYQRANGTLDCLQCQALVKRRARSGEPTNSPLRHAALQAFQALEYWSGDIELTPSEGDRLSNAWQALGDALGWPNVPGGVR